MDIPKIATSIKNIKLQLKALFAATSELIERNSHIDNGSRFDPNQISQSTPKFELLLEDFLSTCVNIELTLKTIQEYIQQGRASAQNFPLPISNLRCDPADAKIESNEVSYNQYLTAVKYQVDTAKAIRSILIDFVNQQQSISNNRQQT